MNKNFRPSHPGGVGFPDTMGIKRFVKKYPLQKKGDHLSRAAAFLKLLAIFIFIMNLATPLKACDNLTGRPASNRSNRVRPDGVLEFTSPDGVTAVSIVIEIADTPEACITGLMNRPSLHLTDGMLFVFPQAEVREFWMFQTPVSLDMIFVDSQKTIIHIVESTRPMSTQLYNSRFPAQYVVEVQSGFTKLYKIENGMRIRWQRR